jgi:hypothetical protein
MRTRDIELEEFNKGPTAGALNDKRRMAYIYEELLNIRDLLTPPTEE